MLDIPSNYSIMKDSNDEENLEVNPNSLFGDLPIGSRFKIEAYGNHWLTKTGNESVEISRSSSGTETANLNPQVVITAYQLPNEDEVNNTLRENRKRNRMREPLGQDPEWAIRLTQAQMLNDLSRAVQAFPAMGPDKNPLDREHKSSLWKDVPQNAFFTKSAKPSEKSKVYAKLTDGQCHEVCDYSEWVKGMDSVTVYRSDEKTIDKLGIDNETVVMVLNAPSPEELEERIADYVAAKQKKGEIIAQNQLSYLDLLRKQSKSFSEAA